VIRCFDIQAGLRQEDTAARQYKVSSFCGSQR